MAWPARLPSFALLLFPLAAPAQDPPPSPPPREREVVVTGDQVREDERRLQDPVPQTGLSEEALRIRNNRRLAEAVRRLPGVLSGGPTGEDKDLRLRGLDKEFTRTLVGGQLLPDGGEKREFQLNRLPSFLVQDVRILRNRTAEYESDGIAGLLDVRLRGIPATPMAEGRFGYGGVDGLDGDLLQASFGFGWRPSERVGALGAADHLDHTFTRHKKKTFSTGKIEREDEVERQISDNVSLDLAFYQPIPDFGLRGFPETAGLLRLPAIVTGPGELHLRPLVLNLEKDKTKSKLVTDPGKASTREDEEELFLQRTHGLSVEHVLPMADRASWLLRGGYFLTGEDKDKDKTAFKTDAGGVFQYEKQTLEAELKGDRAWLFRTSVDLPARLLVDHELNFGADLRWRRRHRDKEVIEISKTGVRTDTTKPKDDYLLHESYSGAWIQDRAWLAEGLSLTPGLRLEHVRLDSESGDGTGDSDSETDLNPSLHLLWRPAEPFALHAAVSRGVNRPKFDELSPFEQEEASRFIVGNPDLEPARSWNFDAGADLAGPLGLFGVNAFYRRIHGVIEEVDTGVDQAGKDVYRVENVGDGWVRGVELEQRLVLDFAGWPPLAGLAIWANQTWLDSELEDSTGRERRFKEQPRFIANAGVDWILRATGTRFSAAWNFVSDRVEEKANGDEKVITATWTIDVSIRQEITGGMLLFLEIDNLTREERTEREKLANGQSTKKVEQAGRGALMGLEWRF